MEKLHTVEEVAKALRVSTATIRKLVKDGELDLVTVGSRWRIPDSSVQRFISGELRIIFKNGPPVEDDD